MQEAQNNLQGIHWLHRLSGWVMASAIALVIGLFIVLSFYAHPFTDDLLSSRMVSDHGLLGSVNEMYHNWTGRVVFVFLVGVLVSSIDLLNSFWVIGVGAIVCLAACLYAFVRTVSRDVWTPRQALGLSLGLLVIYIVTLPAPSHAFYWATGVASNQLALYTVLLTFVFLLPDRRGMSRVRRAGFDGLAVLFAVASAATYDTTMLMLVGLLLFGTIVAFIAKDPRRFSWLAAMVAAAVCGYFVANAPGHEPRMALFEQAPITQAIDYSITNSIKWLVPFVLQPVVLLAAVLFMPAAWTLSRKLREIVGDRPRWMLVVPAMWVAMVICSWLPAQYIMQGNPPLRTMNSITMFVLVGIFGSIVVAMAQAPTQASASAAARLPLGLLSTARVLFAITLVSQGNGNTAILQLKDQAASYDQAMQQRYAIIQEAVAEGQTDVVVPPLPEVPSLLVFAELQEDPEAYANYAAALYWRVDTIRVEAAGVAEQPEPPKPSAIEQISRQHE